jgi:hypothetical protein
MGFVMIFSSTRPHGHDHGLLIAPPAVRGIDDTHTGRDP